MVRECPQPSDLIGIYAGGGVPERFKVFGRLKSGPLSGPVMLAKKGDAYSIKVARIRDVVLKRDRVCVRGKCYALPIEPGRVIFGRVLSGKEAFQCRNGLGVFRKESPLYKTEVIFDGYVLKEVRVVGNKRGGRLKILFGERDTAGFYRDITLKAGEEEVKLEIEEVRI